jgi:hypothetical protein
MKKVVVTTLKVVLLVILYGVLFTVGTSLTTPPELTARMTAEEMAGSARALPLVSLIMTALLAYVVLRSRWHGWRLALGAFAAFYGVNTLLTQIETLAFPAVSANLPEGTVAGFFLTGILGWLPLCVLAVWILGKWRPTGAEAASGTRLQMQAGEWAWKLVAAILLYEAVYFLFGYYIAWRTPGLPEFYGGADPGTFFGQLGNVLRDTAWLPLLQAGRALIWTGLAVILIRMHKGGVLETGLTVGLAFCLLMTAPMLFPNPLMPPEIARAHTIELFWSNLLFGFLLTLLLQWKAPHPRTTTNPADFQVASVD